MILLLLLCCVTTACGGVYSEFVNVTDPELIKQGYSCLPSKPSIGPMRSGHIAYQYSKIFCERAICRRGFVYYHPCESFTIDGLPECELLEDLTKPYPECCKTLKCS